MLVLAGLKGKDIHATVTGDLETRHGSPRANLGWGRSGFIIIRFFFDKQGRLAGHLVYPGVYSR